MGQLVGKIKYRLPNDGKLGETRKMAYPECRTFVYPTLVGQRSSSV
jgi:hypothetical protein